MAEWYECPHCKTVAMLIDGAEKKCSACGESDGRVLTQEQMMEGRDAGTYFNIDPGTGKRAKKKR
jgi:hypothetical protein